MNFFPAKNVGFFLCLFVRIPKGVVRARVLDTGEKNNRNTRYVLNNNREPSGYNKYVERARYARVDPL